MKRKYAFQWRFREDGEGNWRNGSMITGSRNSMMMEFSEPILKAAFGGKIIARIGPLPRKDREPQNVDTSWEEHIK